MACHLVGAIIWTKAGILLIGPFGTNFFNQNSYIFIQENVRENAIWDMVAILTGPQCVYIIVTIPDSKDFCK